MPQMTWAIDGVPAGTYAMTADTGVATIRLPTSDRDRAVVTMEIGPTFDPGPNDERTLGVVVRDITLIPNRAAGRPRGRLPSGWGRPSPWLSWVFCFVACPPCRCGSLRF